MLTLMFLTDIDMRRVSFRFSGLRPFVVELGLVVGTDGDDLGDDGDAGVHQA